LNLLKKCVTIKTESTHSKVDAYRVVNYLSMRGASPVFRQGRHFFYLLFVLKKASNARIKLPKDISKAKIPMKIEIIS